MALTAITYDRLYYDEHTAAGLDYAAYGTWQRDYGRWLVECLDLQGKPVLDIGCACGAQLRGLVEAGAIGHGIDPSDYMINIGRQRNPGPTLHIGHAHDLSCFPDDHFSLIHTHNSAEHWPQDTIPSTFRQAFRLTKPHDFLFAVIDTKETMDVSGNGDPTHITIQPIPWWRAAIKSAGWTLLDPSHPLHNRLRTHPLTFLTRYSWSYFLASR